MPMMIWAGFRLLFSTAYGNGPAWVNLSLSPTRLIKGIGELHSELPIHTRFSLLAISAYGRTSDALNIDLGAQGRYYGIGDAKSGGFLAVELRYANILYRNENEQFDAYFIRPAAIIGGKFQTDIGLTLDAGVGIDYNQTIVSAPGQNDAIRTGDWNRTFRLNVGWMISRSL